MAMMDPLTCLRTQWADDAHCACCNSSIRKLGWCGCDYDGSQAHCHQCINHCPVGGHGCGNWQWYADELIGHGCDRSKLDPFLIELLEQLQDYCRENGGLHAEWPCGCQVANPSDEQTCDGDAAIHGGLIGMWQVLLG